MKHLANFQSLKKIKSVLKKKKKIKNWKIKD